MHSPQPGYPIEGRSASGCAGAVFATSISNDYELFDFHPYVHSLKSEGVHYGALDTTVTYKVRNRFKDEMVAGEELTIMLDADGIGVILVWECDDA